MFAAVVGLISSNKSPLSHRMLFISFGLNYETASVGVREAFALNEQKQRAFYRSLQLSDDAELIVLSTCNRTEVYLYGTHDDARIVEQALAEQAGVAWPADEAFVLYDEAAVRHLLHVASGLKSMVLGDAQILAQVKEAYRVAVDEEKVGAVLHRLMHTAFRAAKRVVTETAVTSGVLSVSGAAVAMAQSHFEQQSRGGLAGRRALLIGAGQMGSLALYALKKYRLASLSVTNRSVARARTVAAAAGASVVPWGDRYEALRESDLIIVATSAEAPVLRAAHLPAQKKSLPVLVIDISIPRNVDRTAEEIPGYRVLDLDALKDWMARVEEGRRAEVPVAQSICESLLAEFVSWMFHQQALQPAVQAIRETFERIRIQEIERHHHRFDAIDREELDSITRSIMQKILAIPIVRLKSTDPESIDFVRGIRLLQGLFTRPLCDDDSGSDTAPAESLADLAPSCMGKANPDAVTAQEEAVEEFIRSILLPPR